MSERLVERHIKGLAVTSANERLDSILAHLEDQGASVAARLAIVASRPEVPAAVTSRDASAAGKTLRGIEHSQRPEMLWMVDAVGRVVSPAPSGSSPADIDHLVSGGQLLPRLLAGEVVTTYEEIDPAWLPAERPDLAARANVRSRSATVNMPAKVLVQLVAVPVKDKEQVTGALVGGTMLTGGHPFTTRLADRQYAAVIVHRGVWVASSVSDEWGPVAGLPISAAQAGALAAGRRWIGPAVHMSEESFAAMDPLKNGRGDVIGGVLGRVSTARLSVLRSDARRSFFIAMGAGATISLLLALLASRQITGPLRRLAQSAAAMEKGQLDTQVPVEGNDEVAQLALALKRTAGALAESRNALEARVRERTRQLEEARDREAALNRDLTQQNEQLSTQSEQLRAQGDELETQRSELVEKTRRGEEADRLKNAFIANMSHEIRTPLNSVLALSQLLRDGMAGSLSADQRKYLEVIERNGQNLLRLISDILDLSRIEAGHLEMDLQALEVEAQIRGAVGALMPLAEAKGLELSARVPPQLPPVLCDADRLRQVLTNLIGNAIKFTEAGQVIVSAEARGKYVAVHVTDTGVGIPEGARSKIFEEFFQVDQTLARRQGGTGLGLAIASRLARIMGGEITVESVVGSGSRFTFTLPQAALTSDVALSGLGAAPAPGEVRAKPSSRGGRLDAVSLSHQPGHGSSILIVEDNEDNLFTLRQILGAQPTALTLATATSGREAIEYCRQRTPDLVIMDMQMPGMSGLQATGAIRALPGGAEIPIVALTAQAMKGDRERILAAGCDEYLAKPIQPAALLSVVTRLLNRNAQEKNGGGPQPSQGKNDRDLQHGTHTPRR
ncbi:MAG TPA: ATP-binding protein [Polyangia bacterium]|nr:ATP-binding protein [Polyangia bacterium]